MSHPAGHGQADFGEAVALIGGVAQKVRLFVMDPAAQRRWVREGLSGRDDRGLLDGHMSAFGTFGGVPRSILYDNTKLAVVRILGDGKQQRTRAFGELTSHYLFEDRFGRLARATTRARSRVWSLCPARLSGAAATGSDLRGAERAARSPLPPPLR